MTLLAEEKRKVAKPLLWVGLVSIVMMFAGLTSGYIVRRSQGNWLQFELPEAFYYSTLSIVLSSLILIWAIRAFKKGNEQFLSTGIGLTFLLGLLFSWFQVQGWQELISEGVYFTGPGSNASGSFLYVITLAHLAHLIGGLIVLIVMFIRSKRGAYQKDTLGLSLGATFWHFLGLLWIYLFLFLLLIR
jgi:cytochrome c oxidase subunit 3